MIIRKAQERGHANFGWLDSWHTFSFGQYRDPRHMGFGPLRVINDDTVAPGGGFATHGHADMEIVSYVLEGAMEHKDSLGTGSVIRPGDVQRMSAGTGIRHSEYNASDKEPLHFLQIWLLPERDGITPGYEQKFFTNEDKRGRLRLVASRDGRDGSVTVHSPADLYATVLGEGENIRHELASGRSGWLHVARGAIILNGVTLHAGDGAAFDAPGVLDIAGAQGGGEALVFDMAG